MERIALPVEQVVHLYLVDRMTMTQIGEVFGCSSGPVKRVLDTAGVRLRTSREKPPLNVAQVVRLYVEHELSCEAVGKMLGCGEFKIAQILDAQGVSRREVRRPDLNNETIKSMYLVDKLSVRQIAGRLGVSDVSILRRLRNMEVPMRDAKAVAALHALRRPPKLAKPAVERPRPDRHDEDIKRWYLKDEQTLQQIADRLGLARSTVRRRLVAMEIPRRSVGPRPSKV